jgi:hypothetical protein
MIPVMPFLSPTDQEKLRTRFEEELDRDVRLILFAEPPTGLYVPGREQSQTGKAATQLLEEVAALSPRLHLEVHNPRIDRELAESYGVERSPAILLLPADGTDTPAAPGGESQAAGPPAPAPPSPAASSDPPAESPPGPSHAGAVRFFGLPSGYEFMTLIEDLVDLSTGSTRLSDATRQAAADIKSPVHLQVFVTPT